MSIPFHQHYNNHTIRKSRKYEDTHTKSALKIPIKTTTVVCRKMQPKHTPHIYASGANIAVFPDTVVIYSDWLLVSYWANKVKRLWSKQDCQTTSGRGDRHHT